MVHQSLLIESLALLSLFYFISPASPSFLFMLPLLLPPAPFDVVFLGVLFTICSPHTPLLCSNFVNNPKCIDDVFWLTIFLLNLSSYILQPIGHVYPFSLTMLCYYYYYYYCHQN